MRGSRLFIRKAQFRLIVLALSGLALQNIPGTYVLEEIEERVDLESPVGRAMSSLGKTEVNGRFYFSEPARHRISRNAEIEVPADTTLTLRAVMVPYLQGDEWILEPAELTVEADRPLVFIYRRVTVARARTLTLNENGRLEAVGYYQVLSALRTAYAYERQREIRRAYEVPAEARVSLSLALTDLEPLVNHLLGDMIPNEFDLGSLFEVRLSRLHHLQFTDNHLDLHVDGTLRSGRSQRVTRVMQPSFRSRLGVDVHLPHEQMLTDAEFGVSLRNIHTFNFSGLNPIFDKLIRDTVRSYRDQARVLFSVSEDFPEALDWPGTLFIEDFRLRGDGGDDAEILLRIHWKKDHGCLSAAGGL
ncbi:MAG: hypothetical protein LAT79_11405 [Kiritimatiellae bacterium]|nr:hypothetical protein [Kiritimatiellia bacterium]